MGKRSGKFYFRNEKETLSKLGLKPAPGSVLYHGKSAAVFFTGTDLYE